MEGNGVGTVQSKSTRVSAGGSLLEVQDSLNFLMVFVSCGVVSSTRCTPSFCCANLTGVLGRRDNLAQQLGEVRKILAQEASLEDDGLTRMRSSQLTTKEFGFASDAEGRSSLGVL